MTRAEYLEKKEKELNTPTVHKKISNNFIDNTLCNSTISALKITYYLSTILKDFDFEKPMNTVVINTKDMLKYTELTMPDIKNNFKKLQETNITFTNEEEEWEEGITLIPRIKFHLGRKRTVEIDIYSKIAKLILEVADNYTFIDTKELMRLKNKHSIRLLPLLKTVQGYDVKQKKFKSIATLNEFFGVNYKRFIDIEKNIIIKAKEELDNNSKLTFDYEMNFEKLGKAKSRIVAITIKPLVKNNYQSTIFSNFDDTTEPKTQPNNTSEKQKDCIEAPTQDEIDFALDECGLKPIEATVKFEMFKKWESEQTGKRNFKKYLIDGLN